MFGRLFQKKQEETVEVDESLSSMAYHEDLRPEDNAKILNLAVELLKMKRDKFLSFTERSLALGSPRDTLFRVGYFLYYTGFLWYFSKSFSYAITNGIFTLIFMYLFAYFLNPRLKKWSQNHSYIAFDKEINDTIAEKGYNIFGFNIEDKEHLADQDLSNVQVFRNNENDEVVGLVVLKPYSDALFSEEDECVVEIGMMGASGIDKIHDQLCEEMLEWCLAKMQTLKETHHKTIHLQIHLLGIDSQTFLFLNKKKFKRISSYKTSDKYFANKLPGFKKHVLELKL
ncbi:hypothetical protein AWRI3579_g569 [Hanseniaspora osmophila]|uniref:Uncharacterized protein n=1 Tax=Hanseniaspora osmophila TaxID=56408 RepID=A0A1E5RTL0_9ASCO|nr:hypothetical protein AWRI3579_g569 [Hanseniaspora osmophila]